MDIFGWIIFFVFINFVLSFNRASLTVWGVSFFVYFILVSFFSQVSTAWIIVMWILAAAIFLPLLLIPLRRMLITKHIFSLYRKFMPKMSRTEREALQAGGVGWEGEIFTGMPDWHQLQKIPKTQLTVDEQDFLDGPVNELCGLISNWEINHVLRNIPENIWDHLKKHGFFGLIIPREYGGKGFSALAHSQIIAKVAGISTSVGVVVSVPNSLGPAELLLEYGTEQQKDYFLPRLARGEDIPCFALTSPQAGSDAGAIEDHGVVCKQEFEGKETLGILLNWSKRYITLSPVATVLGLAFKLYDPDKLLGDEQEIGITCALIPVGTEGVVTGRRHFPLSSHFPNGPTQGKDVFIPLEWVIGGREMVGCGWRMLMECLAAGRSISLPSMVTGGAKRAVYASGAYSRIRRQFNTHIGAFGGVQEALVRICTLTYLIEAVRLFSVCSIDRGVKSAVSSAICKYQTTQTARTIMNDAMDIHGGKGICMGPHNYLAQSYIEGPISITVEGANILTRSMIVFGQGAVRAHPYVLTEMNAAKNKDSHAGLRDFDQAFFKHLGMISSNKVRALVMALTSSYVANAPRGDMKRYYQHFSRFSAAFSYLADISMMTIGGDLKRKERLSARLGDMLSLVYMGSSVLKYYQLEGNQQAQPVVEWICQDLLFRLQTAFSQFLRNFPIRWMACWFQMIIFPVGKHFHPPSDKLGRKVAALMLEPNQVVDRLAQHLYTDEAEHRNPVGAIRNAFIKAIAVEPLLKRLHKAQRKHEINGRTFSELVAAAIAANIISEDEGKQLREADVLRMEIINVDDFSQDEFSQA